MMHPCVMPACLSTTAYSSTSTGCSCATCVAGIALKPVPCMRWTYCCLQQSGTGLTLAWWLQIDNDGELEGGIIKLKATEIVINSIKLRWKDKATGEVREEGKTKPEVVMRQLGSQPGQVGPTWAGGLHTVQPPRSECSSRPDRSAAHGGDQTPARLCAGWATRHGRSMQVAVQLPVCASLGSVAVCTVG